MSSAPAGKSSAPDGATTAGLHIAGERSECLCQLVGDGACEPVPSPDVDRIVRIAARYFRVSTAVVTLVDRDRLWLRCGIGVEMCRHVCDGSFCAEMVATREPLVVSDTRTDARFKDLAVVTAAPHVRFFAGAPLVSGDGHARGLLCLIDFAPRLECFNAADLAALADFAALVVDAFDGARVRQRFYDYLSVGVDTVWELDPDLRVSFASDLAGSLDGDADSPLVGLSYAEFVKADNTADDPRWLAHLADLRDGRPFHDVRFPVKAHGLARHLSLSGRPLISANGTFLGYRGVSRDVTAEVESLARIKQLAYYDPLTNLPNRRLFGMRLRRVCDEARTHGRGSVVILLELDQLREVRASLGFTAGDRLMVATAARLSDRVRETDTVAHLGVDQFAVLLNGLEDDGIAADIAAALLHAASEPVFDDGGRICVAANAGIARIPADGTDPEDILSNAGLGLQRAREEHAGAFHFFQPALRHTIESRRSLEAELHRALAEDQLVLHYQPQVRLADRLVVGVEALMRWNHPERGLVPPGGFLPVVEAGPLAEPYGWWTVREALRQLRAWVDSGVPPMRMGINITGAQFRGGDFAATVAAIASEIGVPFHLVELEVTENILLERDWAIEAALAEARRLGFGVAFDDFGTGYASLSHLRRFPLDRIKIDRQFVRDIGSGEEGALIAKAIVGLGKSLGLQVVAEGIEERVHEDFLRAEGCDEAQGFFYARPAPAPDIRRLLGATCAPASVGSGSVA